MARSETSHFIEEGTAAVLTVRRALAELLDEVGAKPGNPRDLSRRFGLDKMLTWHVARVVESEDAWAAVSHIPRRPSAKILTAALSKHGASELKVNALHDALESFERFVEEHSGDRETLEVMAGIAGDRTGAKRLAIFQKQAFQANSAIWGVSAAVQFRMYVLAPSTEVPGTADLALVAGFIGFRRLRPNLHWAAATMQRWDSSHQKKLNSPVPLQGDGADGGAPLLRHFCSDALPDLERVDAPDGSTRFEVSRGRVGNSGAANIVLGWRWPSRDSMHAKTPGERADLGAHLNTPVESALLDLYVHRDLDSGAAPDAALWSEMPGGPRYPAERSHAAVLPVANDIVSLGAYPPNTTTQDVPRYREMFEFLVERLGRSPADFRGYRYRVNYPPVPTLALIRYPLPAPPGTTSG